MKKLFVTTFVLAMAIVAMAQVKVAPTLKVGAKHIYTTEQTIKVSGQNEIKLTDETEFVVASETADGYVLDITTTKVESNAANEDLMARLLTMSQEVMKGVTIRVAADKQGSPTKILNYADVQKSVAQLADNLIAEIIKAHPETEQSMPKDELKKQLADGVSEDMLLLSLKENTSPLALNGKSIANGVQDSYSTSKGLKMKRMYFAMGKKIVVNASLDMTKDDLKKMVIKQVEETMPDQAELVKQNIDMLLGSMKFEATEKATYELNADNWVKTIATEQHQELMGQKVDVTATITLK